MSKANVQMDVDGASSRMPGAKFDESAAQDLEEVLKDASQTPPLLSPMPKIGSSSAAYLLLRLPLIWSSSSYLKRLLEADLAAGEERAEDWAEAWGSAGRFAGGEGQNKRDRMTSSPPANRRRNSTPAAASAQRSAPCSRSTVTYPR